MTTLSMSTRRIQATLDEGVVTALELRARTNNRSLSEELALQLHSRSPRAERIGHLLQLTSELVSELHEEVADLREGTAKQFLRERQETREEIQRVEQLARGAANLTERVTVAQLSAWTGMNWNTKTSADVGKALKDFSLQRGDDPAHPDHKIPHPVYLSINSYKPEIVRQWLEQQGQPIPKQLKYLQTPADCSGKWFDAGKE